MSLEDRTYVRDRTRHRYLAWLESDETSDPRGPIYHPKQFRSDRQRKKGQPPNMNWKLTLFWTALFVLLYAIARAYLSQRGYPR